MKVSNKKLRVGSRQIHLVGAAFIGMFVYAPWGNSQASTVLMQFVVIPLLALTGVAMWKQAFDGRLLRLGKPKRGLV